MPDPALAAAPYARYRTEVREEWIDYNGHLNDAGYAIVLSEANEVLLAHLGLSADADAWQRHCEATCRRWARRGAALSFAARRVEGAPRSGDSVEAWARGVRYAALRGCECWRVFTKFIADLSLSPTKSLLKS